MSINPNFPDFSSLSDLVSHLKGEHAFSGIQQQYILDQIKRVPSPTNEEEVSLLKREIQEVVDGWRGDLSWKVVAREALLDIELREHLLSSGDELSSALKKMGLSEEGIQAFGESSSWEKSEGGYTLRFEGIQAKCNPKEGTMILQRNGTFVEVSRKIFRSNYKERTPEDKMEEALFCRVKGEEDTPYVRALVLYNEKAGKTSIYASDQMTCIETGLVTHNVIPRVTRNELEKIHNYILENKEAHVKEAKELGVGEGFPVKTTGLALPLCFTQDGRVLASTEEGPIDLATGEKSSFDGKIIENLKKADRIVKSLTLSRKGLVRALSIGGIPSRDMEGVLGWLKNNSNWEKTPNGYVADSKRGFSIRCDRRTGDLTLIQKGVIWDLSTGIATSNPDPETISLAEEGKLHSYIVAHKKELMEKAKSEENSQYVSTRATGLPCDLQFTQDGRVFAILNKQPAGFLERLSMIREAKEAVEIPMGTRFLSISMESREAHREIDRVALLAGEGGFEQIKDIREERANRRVHLLYAVPDKGTLLDLVQKGSLSGVDKRIITERLLKSLTILEKKGAIHRDLTLKNIGIVGAGGVRPVIMGLRECIGEGDSFQKRQTEVTAHASPEQIRASYFFDHTAEAMEEATTKASNVWAMGLILDKMWGTGFSPTFHGKERGYEIQEKIRSHKEAKEPHRNTVEHLIWSMLRKDPNERATPKQLLAHPVFRGGL